MAQLQNDLRFFAEREDALQSEIDELKSEKLALETATENLENATERQKSLEEEIAILTNQEECFQGIVFKEFFKLLQNCKYFINFTTF